MKQAMTPEEIKEKKPYLDWSLTEAEYDYIRTQLLGRLPNYTETGLFSAMWSEHCSYKKSKPVLRLFPNKNERVLQGPGEGAGVVDIDDGQAVVFKAESHNHPTTVEPFKERNRYSGFTTFQHKRPPPDSSISVNYIRQRDEVQYCQGGDYSNCMGILQGETTLTMLPGNIL